MPTQKITKLHHSLGMLFDNNLRNKKIGYMCKIILLVECVTENELSKNIFLKNEDKIGA